MNNLLVSLTAALLLAAPGTSGSLSGEDQETSPPGPGWLGVSIQDMTPRLARTMDLKTKEGALVSDVADDSPAEKAGLKEEDIIVEFAGKPVTDADQLREAVRAAAPGVSVPVVVMRRGERTSLTVSVGRREKHVVVAPRAPKAPRAPRLAWIDGGRSPLGLRLRTLDEQLGRFFKAPDGRGVLVESVKEKSAAAEAGFKAGDVIVKAGTRVVEEVYDVQRAIRRADIGEKLPVEIIRNGAKQTLAVTIKGAKTGHDGDADWLESSPHGHLFEYFDSGEPFELDIEIPDIAPEMDELRLELQGLEGSIRRELDRVRPGKYRIHRQVPPPDGPVSL